MYYRNFQTYPKVEQNNKPSNTQHPAFNLVSYNLVEQTLMQKQGIRLIMEENVKTKPKQMLWQS